MVNIASAAVKTTPIDENASFLLKQLFDIDGSAAKTLVESKSYRIMLCEALC